MEYKIEKIIINNYRSIKQVSLNLEDINIFIGPNGSGKSNIISFFRMVQSFFYEININENLNRYFGEARKIINYDSTKLGFNMSATLIFSDQNHIKNLRNVYEFILGLKGSQSSVYFVNESFSVWDKEKYEKWKPIILNNENEFKSNFYNSLETYEIIKEKILEKSINIKVYEHIRDRLYSIINYHFHDVGVTSLLKRGYSDIYANYILNSTGDNLATILYKMQQNNNESYKFLIDSIKNVAPYFYDFRFFIIKNEDKQYIQVKWLHQKFGDELMELSDLSDGTLRFIALAVSLLQDVSNKIITIDEPELGLHPWALKVLSSLIKYCSKNNQLIISTQNRDLLKEFNANNIFVLNYIDGETKITKLCEDEHLNKLVSEMIDNGSDLGEIWISGLIGGDIKW